MIQLIATFVIRQQKAKTDPSHGEGALLIL